MKISGTEFGTAAADYGSHRAGFPESFFERLAAFDIGLPEQTVIDLGTGTGTLARRLAVRGCNVIGVDADPRMIAQATQLDRQDKVSVRYVEAKAEATGLEAGTADVVTAGQCWHWFDRPQAAAEAIRLLRRCWRHAFHQASLPYLIGFSRSSGKHHPCDRLWPAPAELIWPVFPGNDSR